MKKLLMVLLLVFSLSACDIFDDDENIEENIEENDEVDIFRSPYAERNHIPNQVASDIFYNYNDIFAGFDIDNGAYHIYITEDTPQSIIDMIEEESSLTYHIVDHSFAQLFGVKEIVMTTLIDMEISPWTISIAEEDNTIQLTMYYVTAVPECFDHYIENGMLTVTYSDLEFPH